LTTLIILFQQRPAIGLKRPAISANADVDRRQGRQTDLCRRHPPLPISTAPLTPALCEQAATGPPGCRPRFAAPRLCATFAQAIGGSVCSAAFLKGGSADAEFASCFRLRFSPQFSVPLRLRPHAQVVARHGWFLRYVGYAVVGRDPAILAVKTPGGSGSCSQKGCSLAATKRGRPGRCGLRPPPSSAQETEAHRQLVSPCFKRAPSRSWRLPTPPRAKRLGQPVQSGPACGRPPMPWLLRTPNAS